MVGILLLGTSPISAAPGPSAAASPAPTGTPVNHTTPYIQHVVFIVLENQGLYNILLNGPYEVYLASVYGHATNFFAACHPSAGNYIAMIAAVTNQCGNDSWNSYTNGTLGNLLHAQGLSSQAYAEDLPNSACTAPGNATGHLFATRHVPFLYFARDTRSLSYCQNHLHAGRQFRSDVSNGTLANFSFYSPNLCNDGHTGCGGNVTLAQLARQADTWLSGFLAPILNHTGIFNSSPERALIAHTLFVITYDEGFGPGANAGYPVAGVTSGENYAWCAGNGARGDAVCGGKVFTIFVSPYSLGLTFTLNDSDYGLVHTVEWLFHLGHLHNPGRFDGSAAFPAMRGLFSFKHNGQ